MAGDDAVRNERSNDAVEIFWGVGPRKEVEFPIGVCAGEAEDAADLFAARFGLAVEECPNPKRFLSRLWFHGDSISDERIRFNILFAFMAFIVSQI